MRTPSKRVSANKDACPVTATAKLLSDTWTMLIMRALTEGPKRWSGLKRWLTGISSRTLALKLRKLHAAGLIRRLPDGVYAATAKGKGLKVVEDAMIRYAKRYLRP